MSETKVKCKICENSCEHIFSKTILQKHIISYFQCSYCGFAQTESPYWLDESYSESMNLGDTGQVTRNQVASKIILPIISTFFDRKGKLLDFAGGYGLLTRMMRDLGLDYYWVDKYTQNIFAKGFERPISKTKFELISIFECFEHWNNPLQEIQEILEETDSILFTTNIISRPAPKPDFWWYYGFDHGQHIAFYSTDSFKIIANKFNLNYYSKYGYHLLTRKKINPIIYKIIVILSIKGFSAIFGSKLESKTISDSLLLVNKKENNLK